jgi:alpha-tubulin suppressor-like RCC1 family protein
VAITSGDQFACILTTEGGVKCWGNNANGLLGDGTNEDRYALTDVTGLTANVSAISSGSGHTCALTTEGGVKCWGQNKC